MRTAMVEVRKRRRPQPAYSGSEAGSLSAEAGTIVLQPRPVAEEGGQEVWILELRFSYGDPVDLASLVAPGWSLHRHDLSPSGWALVAEAGAAALTLPDRVGLVRFLTHGWSGAVELSRGSERVQVRLRSDGQGLAEVRLLEPGLPSEMIEVRAPLPSHAFHGEDVLALAILRRAGVAPDRGFYVDVGAYHPLLGSNTALLSQLGWHGVLIEPNPAMAERARLARPRDTVLGLAAGTPARRARLLMFDEWASSNTLDQSFGQRIANDLDVSVAAEIDVEVRELGEILAQHVGDERTIDLLSVDVEGLDLEVLRSNDWARFRPTLVAVEDLSLDLTHPERSEIFQYLSSHDYTLVGHALLTSLYLTADLAPHLRLGL